MRLTQRLLTVSVTAMMLALGIATSCGRGDPVRSPSPALTAGGDQAAGRRAIMEQGCGACHRIPGIPNANSLVGPPLDGWSRRSFIAGTLPNSAENLQIWLENPQQVRPGSAMPDLGLDATEIIDIATYLFTLD